MESGRYRDFDFTTNYQMKKIFLIAMVSVIWIFTSGFSIIRYDGDYRGSVIDAETGEPIEGAVVLGVWYKEVPTVAGPKRSYYDARETVTDKNGEFSIPGKGLIVLSNLEPMSATIFKAGYNYEVVSWSALFRELHEEIKWEDDKPIITLKKLTMEERRKRGSPPDPPTKASKDKVIHMLKEINKDRIDRGLPPRKIWGGDKI